MSDFVPLLNEVFDFGSQIVFGFEIHNAKPFSFKDAKPLFDLVDPRTVRGSEVELEPRMSLEPFAHLLSMMRGDVVDNEMDPGSPFRDFLFQSLQEGDEFPLTLPVVGFSVDATGSGVKGGEQLQGSGPLVLMFHLIGTVARLGRSSDLGAGPRLLGSLLIDTQHHFPRAQGTSIQVNNLVDGTIERSVSRRFRRKPHVATPWL